MIWLHLVLRFDDLLSCHPSLPGHYPVASLRSPLRGSQWLAISLRSARRYYDGSDCCQPSRDVPALAALLCSRHHPCLAYDHQPPQHSPRQVPYLPSRTGTRTHQGFAIDEQARRSVVAESCSLSLSSVRFFSLLSTPPRGDAVTSSSHQEHGSRWPGSPTPEDCDASQRTRPHSPSEGFARDHHTEWDGDFSASPNSGVTAPAYSRSSALRHALRQLPRILCVPLRHRRFHLLCKIRDPSDHGRVTAPSWQTPWNLGPET